VDISGARRHPAPDDSETMDVRGLPRAYSAKVDTGFAIRIRENHGGAFSDLKMLIETVRDPI
jgi:hypothetical protein